MEYRIEKKYIVTDFQIAHLQNKLSQIMQTDKHHQDKAYQIRSLYFDDYYNTGYWENEDSIAEREKFRIRIYEAGTDMIKLEEKAKHLHYIRKQATAISMENCKLYMNGEIPDLLPDDPFLIKKMYAKMQMSYLKPVIIVEYERTAYVDPIGNVRITFDRNICGSREVESFLDKEIAATPILPKGEHIMEVKYDELLPDYIHGILMEESLQRTSFSKYYYARNNEMLY